ncbi:MAG: GIY-YIG nuclease family protein [Minisyncoccota bacterium]
MWYVYFLRSRVKKWYYVGSTNNLKRRITEHNISKVQSTKRYKPFDIVFQKVFNEEQQARLYERMLKDKRIEKEKLILSVENK